jgi:hypothetical protein
MRKFKQLNKDEQTKAIEICANNILESILNGMSFNDELNKDGLQCRIDAAILKSEEMKTPWFVSEYIMDTCGDDIMGMAECDANDSLYIDNSINVIRL